MSFCAWDSSARTPARTTTDASLTLRPSSVKTVAWMSQTVFHVYAIVMVGGSARLLGSAKDASSTETHTGCAMATV